MDTSVNAANQVVSVGADIAFDADPKFFACLVRFESSSVPTTRPTAYDVYPLFFFQAEDGIRDHCVTGVQTCALPISNTVETAPITLAMGAVSTVFADAVSGLLPVLGGALPRAVLLIAVIAGLAVVNIRGAALGSQVSGIATIAKIVPLIAFVALGLSHVRAENLALGSFPSLARLGESGLLLMFAFFGMESALQVSGEVRDAARAVPRAIALGVTGVGVLYIAVHLVAQGILGSALAAPETANAPLAAAAVQFAGQTGSTLILIAMIVSTFGFMTATMLATPRTLFAFAVDGYLPRPLARVHPAHHTPYVAIAVQGVIVCAIAITGTYVKLAIKADVAVLLVYLACCLAAWRLRRLKVGVADNPFVMPGGRVVPWVAAGLIAALLARATAQAWLLTGGVMAVASVAFLMNDVRKRRRTES